jgi:hypothetical protein
VITWNTVTGSERRRLDLGMGPVNAVAAAPDGLTLAVAGDRGLIVVDLD